MVNDKVMQRLNENFDKLYHWDTLSPVTRALYYKSYSDALRNVYGVMVEEVETNPTKDSSDILSLRFAVARHIDYVEREAHKLDE